MDVGENVSARRELDTLCGLSKREKGNISERKREVRLLAELPHDLRTRERCGEWVRSLELLLLPSISHVRVLGKAYKDLVTATMTSRGIRRV